MIKRNNGGLWFITSRTIELPMKSVECGNRIYPLVVQECGGDWLICIMMKWSRGWLAWSEMQQLDAIV